MNELDLRIECRRLIEGKITEETCLQIVQIIKQLADDDEVAHSLEDEFREAVLLVVNHPLAKIALTTSEIRFARWCA